MDIEMKLLLVMPQALRVGGSSKQTIAIIVQLNPAIPDPRVTEIRQ